MFSCDKCGQCCRNLNMSEQYSDLDRGDGTCRYLVGNICSIYEKRPLKCRIDDFYNVYLKEKLSIEEYYKLNYEACKILKQKKEND